MYYKLFEGVIKMSEIIVKKEPNILNPNEVSFEERQKELENQRNYEEKDSERKKKSPYKEFVQVNKATYKAEDWLMSKSPVAYRIFRFLANNMDGYNAVVCSYQVLQEQFDVSKETIRKSIKLLKDKQYIDIYKSGSSNVYAINKEMYWNSWGTNHKYAKFGANIILSETEQEEYKTIETKKVKESKVVKKDNEKETSSN